jgi:hypothetical protein
MLKYFFAFIILMHGLIHFMGFAKAYGYGDMKQLTLPISKPVGSLWMLTAFLFIAATILFLLKKEYWLYLAIPAAILSQIFIVMVWKDAKWGTVANIIILIVAVLAFTTMQFEKVFRADVQRQFQQNKTSAAIITETDIQHLPPPVQRYLRYSNVIGKPKPTNMHVVFEGEMRSKGKNWFKFTSEQYNFFEEPTRLFFMKAKMFGITVPGYHRYQQQTALMNIKLFGLIDVVKIEYENLAKGETVTVFNDMCLMAPGFLIDKRIAWEPINDSTAKATFTNGAIKVSAVLYFNQQGQLIDFISNERYETNIKQWLPFSTPVSEYKNINNMNLISYGEAVWHYPDSAFVYGKFWAKNIEYNIMSLN